MPQEFIVLRCYNCERFQVHQTKKSKKWECKVCGEKQSLKKAYLSGAARNCRTLVQKLNFEDGERKLAQMCNQNSLLEEERDEHLEDYSDTLDKSNDEDCPIKVVSSYHSPVSADYCAFSAPKVPSNICISKSNSRFLLESMQNNHFLCEEEPQTKQKTVESPEVTSHSDIPDNFFDVDFMFEGESSSHQNKSHTSSSPSSSFPSLSLPSLSLPSLSSSLPRAKKLCLDVGFDTGETCFDEGLDNRETCVDEGLENRETCVDEGFDNRNKLSDCESVKKGCGTEMSHCNSIEQTVCSSRKPVFKKNYGFQMIVEAAKRLL